MAVLHENIHMQAGQSSRFAKAEALVMVPAENAGTFSSSPRGAIMADTNGRHLCAPIFHRKRKR